MLRTPAPRCPKPSRTHAMAAARLSVCLSACLPACLNQPRHRVPVRSILPCRLRKVHHLCRVDETPARLTPAAKSGKRESEVGHPRRPMPLLRALACSLPLVVLLVAPASAVPRRGKGHAAALANVLDQIDDDVLTYDLRMPPGPMRDEAVSLALHSTWECWGMTSAWTTCSKDCDILREEERKRKSCVNQTMEGFQKANVKLRKEIERYKIMYDRRSNHIRKREKKRCHDGISKGIQHEKCIMIFDAYASPPPLPPPEPPSAPTPSPPPAPLYNTCHNEDYALNRCWAEVRAMKKDIAGTDTAGCLTDATAAIANENLALKLELNELSSFFTDRMNNYTEHLRDRCRKGKYNNPEVTGRCVMVIDGKRVEPDVPAIMSTGPDKL